MPSAPARRCLLCKQLFTGAKCPRCHPAWEKRPGGHWPSGSDSRWRAVRATQLLTWPRCAMCGGVATEVDHLDGTDYDTQRYDPAMLRSLCHPCHHKRTIEQSIAARRKGRP